MATDLDDMSAFQKDPQITQEDLQQFARSAMGDGNTKLFGLIPLPKFLYATAIALLPAAIEEFTGLGAKQISQGVTKAGTKLGVNNADRIGTMSGKGFSLLFPYVRNIGDVYGTVKTHRENTRWLHQQVATLTAANMAARSNGVVGKITGKLLHPGVGNDGNKMLAYASGLIRKGTMNNLTMDSINVAPSILTNLKMRTAAKFEELEKTASFNPEGDQAKVLDTRKKVLSWVIKGFGPLSAAAEGELTRFSDNPQATIAATSLGTVLAIEEYMRREGIGTPKYEPNVTDVREVAQMVADAFQKYQREQHYAPLPTRPLQETAQLIAENLIEGDMHALSLINIIGKEQLLDGKKSSFISKDKIQEVIAKETTVLSKTSTLDVEAYMNDRDYTLDDIKAHLQSSNADEKALVVLLHPAPVLKAAGLKQNQIDDLQNHLSTRLTENMFVAVIGGLDRKSDSELQDMGYNRHDVQFIREAAQDPELLIEALHTAAGQEKVKNVVGNAVMGESAGGEYWQDLVTKSKNMPEPTSPDHEPNGPHGKKDRSPTGASL